MAKTGAQKFKNYQAKNRAKLQEKEKSQKANMRKGLKGDAAKYKAY